MKNIFNMVRKAALVVFAVLFFISSVYVNTAYATVQAALGVTQITAVQTFAKADDSYADGWKWVFDVTVPQNQTLLQMKFADWVSGSNTIPAANNIRFYSEQSTNASTEDNAISIDAADSYSGLMYLNPSTDLDVQQGGRQIEIVVEARVPDGSAGGSYSTSYGINTTAPATVTISNTNQTYNATGKSVTVTTDPANLATQVTYDGSTNLPIHAGTYNVVVTVIDPGYTGTSTAALTINPAPITVAADTLTKTYDGSTTTDPALTYTSIPAQLFGDDQFTGELSRDPGENVGTYTISQGSLVLDKDYALTFVPNTFTITPAKAQITLSNLKQTYNATGKSVTVTTDPANLATQVTYDGSSDLPINAGNHVIHVEITDPNYIGTANDTLVIDKASLTVTAAADTKVYDGTIESSSTPTVTSGQFFGSDSGTFSQTFDTKDVGHSKTLTPLAVINDGNGGNNYDVTLVNNTDGQITPATATVTATGHEKTYDGTTNATVDLAVMGAVGGDQLTATGNAQFEDKNAGSDRPIDVTNIAITGPGVTSDDYAYNTTASTSATILQKHLDLTANDATKVYGDTLSFTGTEFTVSGLVNSESIASVTLTSDGALPAANVGPYDIIPSNAVAGPDTNLDNYSFGSEGYKNGTLTVTQRNLTATITADNKVYNGSDTATISQCELANTANNDGVTCTASNAHFSDKNVGNGKAVTADVTLSDNGNYTVTTPVTTTANITARPIIINAVSEEKTYDGSTSSSKTPAIDNSTQIVSGDNYTLSQVFDSKDAGNRKLIPSIDISDGNNGNNYNVTANSVDGTIDPKAITVSATGHDKEYDGTAAATVDLSVDGVVSPDDVGATYSSAIFVGSTALNGGEVGKHQINVKGITLTGAGAGNYTANNTSATTSATITPKSLTISGITIASRVYDSSDVAILVGTPALTGVIGSDDVTLSNNGVSAHFDNKNVGQDKPITLTGSYSLSGKKANDYSLVQPTGLTGDITPLGLTAHLSADNKVYDGTTNASTTCSIVGVLSGDNIQCNTSGSTFNTRNAGNNTVTANISLSGTDALDYSVPTSLSTIACITPLALTVTAQPNQKVYDGTTSALAIPTVSPSIASGDTANFIEIYDNADVGQNKTLTPSGDVNDGNEGANYRYTFMTNTTGVITQANQTITFTSIPDGTVTGNSFTVAATSTSGLGVVFSGGADGVCTVTMDGTVNLIGSGQCPVTAKQGGNDDFLAAEPVTKIFQINFQAHDVTTM